jgi:NAD(P)H-flavin reductase/hemoglobin-like flavoprotein
MTYCYGHIFAMDAEIRAMFPPAMDDQRSRFYQALSRIAGSQDDPATLRPYLEELGRAHRKFGVKREHYQIFRRALLATLQRYQARSWNTESQQAWEAAFDQAADIMIQAAERDAEHAPPWWLAEITGHHVRGPDIAVLTLRPGQPLSFLPGQHLSVQTPRWPRLWRTYSIANAPREDGLLTLHVRAVPGGLISNTLVHHVSVGDMLLLGAPSGTMTADPRSERDVLCLADGTGLAPIKAIVEAITDARGSGRRREIALYYGARHESDLYDLPALRRLESAYPWLQVIPAVEQLEGRERDVIRAAIPELTKNAHWADRDIYVSGPDAMVIKTVRMLKDLGAPDEHIHHDTLVKPEPGAP